MADKDKKTVEDMALAIIDMVTVMAKEIKHCHNTIDALRPQVAKARSEKEFVETVTTDDEKSS